ncbi:MAG: hypothetical protein GY932_12430 [Arcobacter sp.]|nr:hypothetical protein [Arcobacter sp.]
MRYLIIALLVMCFSFTLFAQKKIIFQEKKNKKTEKFDDIKFTMKLLFQNGMMTNTYYEIQDTVVSGFYYVNEVKNGFGCGAKVSNGILNDSFFGFPSWEETKYDTALSERKFNLESSSRKPDISKVVFYEIKNKLLQENKDSIALFLKYAIYSLVEHPGKLHYQFDVKLYHEMIIVPFNEVVLLDSLGEHLNDHSASLAITKTTKEERELYSKFTTRNFYQIYEATKESKIENNKFRLGLEFVQSDKNNENILLRQLEYPLESAMVLADEDNGVPINLPASIYKGEFRFPFVIMNNKKAEQYKNDELVKKFLKSNYNIFVVPIKYNNNELTVDVFIGYGKIWGFFPNLIKKRLTIEKGKKIKLKIPDLKKIYKANANKTNYEIDTYEDYEKYVNEYIVISFEYTEEE